MEVRLEHSLNGDLRFIEGTPATEAAGVADPKTCGNWTEPSRRSDRFPKIKRRNGPISSELVATLVCGRKSLE
jgi:hypothetical protein